MPIAAPKPCIQCGALVRDGTSRCQAHKTRPGTFADKRRGSRHERGYGTAWDRTRERILCRLVADRDETAETLLAVNVAILQTGGATRQ
ncbi:hypothetical protein [Azohydromonas sp.]|uniref:hypothetical protein n=1 Tax=Azohydromonas sp. TaxID=1872666 RepID=UPI002C291354|nr:hypothetical protein [Azohydromonas sp.]HMM83915.1 hypothetical protein [Azohydromonas sp.]